MKRWLIVVVFCVAVVCGTPGTTMAKEASYTYDATAIERVEARGFHSATRSPTQLSDGTEESASPSVGPRASSTTLHRSVVATEAVDEVGLQPYGGPGGGHHVPAKSAFNGAAGYDANEALAVPNSELARLGVSHAQITGRSPRCTGSSRRLVRP